MKNIKVGIITGSTREGRASLDVANWVLDNIKGSEGVSYDIIDIKDYDLPFFGTYSDDSEVVRWNQTLMQYDGFIFVTAEYNQSITGALKNAIDSMKDFHDKSVPHISQVTLRVTSLQNSSIFYQELLG